MTETLKRVVSAASRAAEFLEVRALQSQTGRVESEFGAVVIKELLDNALDAAESGGAMPVIEIEATDTGVMATDNGIGFAPEIVAAITDFDVLVSDKVAYRSPTRGLQGNAMKTIIGIPYALGVHDPVTIEAQGIKHEIAVRVDPGGFVSVEHHQTSSEQNAGTRVTVPLPEDLDLPVGSWVQAFAMTNPHAGFFMNDAPDEEPETYKPTVGAGWRKPLPGDKTSAHWYDVAALTRLVFAHIGAARRDPAADMPIGLFIRTFAGLTSTVKAKRVAQAVPEVARVSDFADHPDAVAKLLAAMKEHSRAPKPRALGEIGEAHIRERFENDFGIERFWYQVVREVDDDGLPWVMEIGVAETEEPGRAFYAANFSPTFADVLGDTPLGANRVHSTGAESFLRQCDAFPDKDNDYRRAALIHVTCPGLEFTDKGKTRIGVPSSRAQVEP